VTDKTLGGPIAVSCAAAIAQPANKQVPNISPKVFIGNLLLALEKPGPFYAHLEFSQCFGQGKPLQGTTDPNAAPLNS
jgi:hypothetical protein